MFTSKLKRLAAVAGAGTLAAAALAVGVGGNAQAAPVYGDSQVTASHQSVDSITSITAEAYWHPGSGGPTCPPLPIPPATSVLPFTSPTPLGSAFTVIEVPSTMCAQLTTGGTASPLNETWSIVPGSEVNIPAGVTIGINPASGLLTVTPPAGAVTPANNQDISLKVEVTDGAATAFEMLNAKPIIVNGIANCGGTDNRITCIQAIWVTAVTDAVTLIGTNNNVTDAVDFTSSPAGAGFTLANAPNGVALNGSHLAATNARPDKYTGLSVTATDAMNATAVDTFSVEVDGAVVASDTPRLSGGHAVCVPGNSARMNVFYVQSGSPSWDHFTIVGPGLINGHQGWVNGHLGVNQAVYGGLLGHHGYTVYYQPVTGPGSTTPVPGSHWGYVYFVSGQGC